MNPLSDTAARLFDPHSLIVSVDLDGTLIDTVGEIAEAANRALESHGIARRPVAEPPA